MSLVIYTNESVPVQVASGLQRRNVQAFSARDSGQLGLSDVKQLEFAMENQMVLFTHDDDFLRIAGRWSSKGRPHAGIIYVHQDKFGIGGCIRKLKEIADLFEFNDFENHIEFL